jgi:hypothetical protein
MSQQPNSEQEEAPRTPEQHNRPSASSLFFSLLSNSNDNNDDARNNDAILGTSAPAASSMFRSLDSDLPILHRHRRARQQEQQQEQPQHEQDLCDFSVTPMTSRPHNCSFYTAAPTRGATSTTAAGLPSIHRRVRSRSLGYAPGLEESVTAWLRQPAPVQQQQNVTSTTTTDYFTVMKRHYTQQQQQQQQQHSPLSHSQTNTTTNKNRNDGGDELGLVVADQYQQQQQQQIDDHHHHRSKSMTDVNDDVLNGTEESTTSLLLSNPSTSATNDPDQPHQNIRLCILYGMINATIILPVLMSFTSIIYRDNAFGPYMNGLTKLTIVSGIVHQLCFSTFSTLPFAVGQGRKK